jgi:hypothetical protein
MTMKKRVETKCRQKCLNGSKLNQISYSGHNTWQNWVFWIRPWNQEAQWGMTHATVSKTEEILHEQTKNQDKGHHFFSDSRGVFCKKISITCCHSESKILSWSPGPYEKERDVRSNGNYRGLDPLSFIIVMCLHSQHCQFVNFWQKMHSPASADSLFPGFVTL